MLLLVLKVGDGYLGTLQYFETSNSLKYIQNCCLKEEE